MAPTDWYQARIEDEDPVEDQTDDFDVRPEDEQPPRGRHMDGCLWSGGGWNCDGACPEGAETYREYVEAIDETKGQPMSPTPPEKQDACAVCGRPPWDRPSMLAAKGKRIAWCYGGDDCKVIGYERLLAARPSKEEEAVLDAAYAVNIARREDFKHFESGGESLSFGKGVLAEEDLIRAALALPPKALKETK